MFKKSHRNEKKVIFDIFSKNNQTFCPENSDLKYSYTTLINGKNQSPVKSSRRVQPSLQSTERWQKLVINNVRLLSEEVSITVKKLDSKLTDTAELELTCLVVNWCPTTWQNPICRPPFWISNGHHFQRACAAVFPPCRKLHEKRIWNSDPLSNDLVPVFTFHLDKRFLPFPSRVSLRYSKQTKSDYLWISHLTTYNMTIVFYAA